MRVYLMGLLPSRLPGEDRSAFTCMRNGCIMLSRSRCCYCYHLEENHGEKSIMDDEWSKRWTVLDWLLAARLHLCPFVHFLLNILDSPWNYMFQNPSSEHLQVWLLSTYSLAAALGTKECQKEVIPKFYLVSFPVTSGKPPENHPWQSCLQLESLGAFS